MAGCTSGTRQHPQQCGVGGRAARQPARRFTDRLQRARCLAPRPDHLPAPSSPDRCSTRSGPQPDAAPIHCDDARRRRSSGSRAGPTDTRRAATSCAAARDRRDRVGRGRFAPRRCGRHPRRPSGPRTSLRGARHRPVRRRRARLPPRRPPRRPGPRPGETSSRVAGWIVTRLTGIAWFDGLETAERPQLADTISAALAAVAVAAAVAAWAPRARPASRRNVSNAALIAGLLVVPGLVDATSHDHAHGDASATGTGTGGGSPPTATRTRTTSRRLPAPTRSRRTRAPASSPTATSTARSASCCSLTSQRRTPMRGRARGTPPPTRSTSPAWRGVTPEQQARAEQLVRDTLAELPAFADVSSVGALGYQSIGDASTGFRALRQLRPHRGRRVPRPDPAGVARVRRRRRPGAPSSRRCSSPAARPIDDPGLVDFGGPLMQWHVHDNLCWGLDEDNQPKVVEVLDQPGETCPALTVNAGAENPMVHVWIAPHECGPFAALEGHGAGQVDPSTGCARRPVRPRPRVRDDGFHRSDLDRHAVRPGEADRPERHAGRQRRAAGVRREPGGGDRSATCRSGPTSRPPRRPGSARSATAATGHEHYIQWEWIDDDVWLDPRLPRRASCSHPARTARSSSSRRCSCCRPTSRSTTCPTSAGR